MYLARLDNEKRHKFLELEIIMAKADGDFSEEERTVIDAHCIEMHIDSDDYRVSDSADDILDYFRKNASSQEKHIIFLELVATVMADNVYHEAEKEIVSKLSEALEISKDDVDEAFDIIKRLKEDYIRCAKFVE